MRLYLKVDFSGKSYVLFISLMCLFNHAMHKTAFFIIKLWCIIEILKLQNVTSVRIHDVRLGSGKKFYCTYWKKALKLAWFGWGDTRKPGFLIVTS